MFSCNPLAVGDWMKRYRNSILLVLLVSFVVNGCGNEDEVVFGVGDTDSYNADIDLNSDVDAGADTDIDTDTDTDTDSDVDDTESADSDTDDFIDLGGTITLTEVTDSRIFQRDSDKQYDLFIEGTYEGDGETIQARVLKDGTDDVVVPWTDIDDSLEDGTFSGDLKDIPGGGWYNIEVRISNSTTAIARGSSKFGVGVLIACTGQSHIDYWFDPGSGSGAPEAHELTRMYRHKQVRQMGGSWTGWQPVTGMGARVFANKVAEALNVPVGLLDYGVGGSALWQRNCLAPANGWWLPDNSIPFPDANNYAVFKSGLESIDNKVEALLWVQGHTDAMGGATVGISTARYKTGLETIFDKMRTDTGVPELPIFISLVTRQQGGVLSSSDANIQAVRTAEEQYAEQDANTYLGCTTIDLPLRNSDNIHHTPEGQKIQANRLAQSVLHILLGEDPYTYHRGPRIENYQVVDSTTIDIHFTHSGGADFTPESEIKGFEVLGNGTGGIVTVTRETAATIRIVIGGDTANIETVQYLDGGNPGNLNLNKYASGYVHDNSPLALPLEGGVVEPL